MSKELNNNDMYNEDELHPPEFLNEEFFASILMKKENSKKIKITKLELMPGTTKADHYASVMFRAKMHYTHDGKEKFDSMIIKTAPVIEGQKKEMLGNFKLFETETAMYTEALPNMEAVLRKYGDKTRLSAKILHYSSGPNAFIVFDDLTLEGFKAINDRWCTMEEVKTALTKLAKLHAISYKLAQEGDKLIPTFSEGSFSSDKVYGIPFITTAVKMFKECIAKHDDLKEYVPHVEVVEEKLVPKCVESFRAYPDGKRDGIFVLNHGDFHMKNFMIKEGASNKLEDLMLVDYQISYFGSPALDLYYACYMLFSPEMREKHRDELYYFYMKSFQDTLRLTEFKGRIPTMLDFQLELLKTRHWELYLFMSFMSFSYILSDGKGDVAKALEDADYQRSLLERPDILEEIRRFLPKFLYRGCFE